MFTSACSKAVQTAQQRLRPFRKLDADQVAFDQGQAGPLENFASLLRMAEQEADKGEFRGIGDRQGHDLDPASLEAANHFQELAHAVLEENRELADRRVVRDPASSTDLSLFLLLRSCAPL